MRHSSIALAFSALLSLSACMEAADYVQPDQRRTIHGNFVEAFDRQILRQDSSEEGLQVGPIYTALISPAAPSSPDPNWKFAGEVQRCATGRCLVRDGTSFTLREITSPSGDIIGFTYEVNNSLVQSRNNFYNGFSSVYRSYNDDLGNYLALETWYQTSAQQFAANQLHAQFVNALRSMYNNAGQGAQFDAVIAGLSSVAQVATNQQIAVTNSRQSSDNIGRERESVWREQDFTQEQERRRTEARERELDQLRRETEARVAEESREREAYRRSLTAGNSDGVRRPICVPVEIGCDARTGCTGQYAGLPQCAN